MEKQSANDEFALPRVIRNINRATSYISGVAIAIIAITTVLDAVSRTAGQGSIAIVYDLNLTLLVVLVFISLGTAQVTGENPEFTSGLSLAPPRLQLVARTVGLLLACAVVIGISFVSWQAVIEAYQSNEQRLGLAAMQTWPSRTAVAAGFSWLSLILLWQAAQLVRGKSIDADPAS